MNKKFIFVFVIMFGILGLFSDNIVLNEIFNPSSIKIGNDRIFIVQDTEVFIYSTKDYKLIKKFGKKGAGPKEFMKSAAPWIPSLTLYIGNDELFINSIGKVSFFSKDGVFKKESRTSGIRQLGRYIPLQQNYVLIKMMQIEKGRYTVSYLTDSNLKEIKELCKVKFPQQSGKKRNPILMAKMADYFDRYSYKDKFVIPNEYGDIYIFDLKGNKVKTFKPEYSIVPINKDFKKKLDNFFSNHKFYKRPYSIDKSRGLIDFGKTLPLFNFYHLADNKIYIFSNYKKDDKYETFIYDFDGKLIRKLFLPIKNLDIFNAVPFDIKDGKIFQLVFDEESEEMKLEIEKICQ